MVIIHFDEILQDLLCVNELLSNQLPYPALVSLNMLATILLCKC